MMCLVALDIAERSLRFRIGTARDFCRFDQLPFREGRRLTRPRGREERFSVSLAEDGQVLRLWEQRKRLAVSVREEPSLEGQGDGMDLLRQEDPPSVFRPSDGQHGARCARVVFQYHFFADDHISLLMLRERRCARRPRILYEKTIALFAFLYYNY